MTTGFAVPTWAWALALGVPGAIVGSFIANLCLRWPRGEPVAAGRSHCDACGRTLSAVELIPLISALVVGGRCRTCKAPIDPLHGRIELACAVAGSAAAWGFGSSPASLACAAFAWLSIPLAVLDWRHFWLPDRLTAALAIAGLAFGGWLSGAPLTDRLAAGAFGFASLWSIAFAYCRMRGREGMGQGDPKLFGAIGLWVGISAMPIILLLAAVAGMASLLFWREPDGPDATSPIPFGTALCIAAIPGWLLGQALG